MSGCSMTQPRYKSATDYVGWQTLAGFVASSLIPVLFLIITKSGVQLLSSENAQALTSITRFIWPATKGQYIELATNGTPAQSANFALFVLTEIILFVPLILVLDRKLEKNSSNFLEVTDRDHFSLIVLCLCSLLVFFVDLVMPPSGIYWGFSADPLGLFFLKSHLYYVAILMPVLLFLTMRRRNASLAN